MNFMENDNNIKSVDKLLKYLSNPVNLIYIRLLRKDINIFSYLSKKETVDEEVFINFLKKSFLFPILKEYLLDILFFIDPKSITNKIFNLCVYYPGTFRNTLLIQMAHMWLTVEQLEILNQKIDTPEAFCKLLCIYSVDDNYSETDFKTFLCRNVKNIFLVDCCDIIERNKVSIAETKLTILKTIVDQSRNQSGTNQNQSGDGTMIEL